MDKAYRAVLIEALAHERAGRWLAASECWRTAARILEGTPGHSRDGTITPGTVLEKRRHGKLQATCTYVKEGEVVYDGQTYSSLSAAANAAAKSLGLRTNDRHPYDGRLFWGVEKYASPTFAVAASDDDESQAA